MSIDASLAALRGFPVVLINGPPRAGKDTAGRAILADHGDGARVLKFASAVKNATHALFGLPDGIGHAAFEHTKDKPNAAFFGQTPREAYIKFSEVAIKPNYGPDHFGRAFINTLVDAKDFGGCRLAVVTDCGFTEEVAPLLAAVGRDAVLLIRVHATARGCSFNGDSRSYVQLPGVATVDLTNDEIGSSAEFEDAVADITREWLASRAASRRVGEMEVTRRASEVR